ncbi:MAG: hypothetical protein QM699_02030 [Amaricoccus sp.]|uniref:hypothetical protein n=1 Tax=Amaricoccus sp. TaxID=1872485 RepID=UPI0039E35628
MADSALDDRTLTGFFDTRSRAEAALVRLTTLGLADVRLTGGDDSPAARITTVASGRAFPVSSSRPRTMPPMPRACGAAASS